MAEESEVITLQDEDGLEHRFNVVDIVEVERRRYAVLLPEDEEEGAAAVIFRMESDDRLVPIDDDDELTRVMTALEETAGYGSVVLEGDDEDGGDLESLEDLAEAEAESDDDEYDEDEDE